MYFFFSCIACECSIPCMDEKVTKYREGKGEKVRRYWFMKIAREEQKKTDTPFLKCKQKMKEKT